MNINNAWYKKVSMMVLLVLFNTSVLAVEFCGKSVTTNFTAGQTITSGTITIRNDADNLYVIYAVEEPWLMSESHLHVASSLDGIPQNKASNPKIGNFTYQNTYEPPVFTDMYTLPLSGIEGLNEDNNVLFLAIHAALVQLDSTQSIIEAETAWVDGLDFPGKSWAMYVPYTLQECDSVISSSFRTQTQGGWGSTANGNNPGTYRDANFAQAFLKGLQVGAKALELESPTLYLSSAAAVQCFLPQGGSPDVLSTDITDPAGVVDMFGNCPDNKKGADKPASVLAGQVVALTLNVAFDLYDPGFGESDVNLKDLIVIDGSVSCDGWTVQLVLNKANAVLSGTDSFSPSAINTCVALINENYVDGENDKGNLIIPVAQ